MKVSALREHFCRFKVLSMALVLFGSCFPSSAARASLHDPSTPTSVALLTHRETVWDNSGELVAVDRSRSSTNARIFLQSPNARFLFGFFSESSGIFTLSIYDRAYPLENEHVVKRVWCASNEKGAPYMVKEGAKLRFGEDGNMALSYGDEKPLWETASSNQSVAALELRDSGNLVLRTPTDQAVWESFNSPVDIMLPGQILGPGMKLVNGIYALKMEVGGLVLYSGSSVKWFWSFYNVGDLTDVIYTRKRPTYAQFTEKGLHLSQDANVITRTMTEELCNFSVKSMDPIVLSDEHKAAALRLSNYGTVHIDVQVSKLNKWKARRLLGKQYLRTACRVCKFPKKHRPLSISSDTGRTLLSAAEKKESKNNSTSVASPVLKRSGSYRKVGIAIGALFGAASVAILGAFCIERSPKMKPPASQPAAGESKEGLPHTAPTMFSFKKVRKITNNFSKKLGDGGFGLVYEGTLKDGSKVAVKTLERTSTQGEKEFKAEVAVMATARHMNVIRLRGYCSQGTRRILIYDFMPNSSLDKWLFITAGKDCVLDWSRRYSIALGTARGLAYLHEECTQQIIHLDVKPENILLDENYAPKVSDFGLAKLMDRDKSRVVTNMRGTPGYLAPEWLHGSSVTTKADVYSFGMVLLELICGRETIDLSKGSEQWFLPAWAVRLVEEGRAIELIDQQLHEEVEYFYEEQAKRSIRVALCCIQEDPTRRPTMSRVIQMLEGLVEPKVPHLSRLNIQPGCGAATRVKDRLVAYAEALADEGATDLIGAGQSRFSEKETPAWNIKGGLGTIVGSARTVLKARNVPCIPPWPLKGDIVVIRGSGTNGECNHAVIRDVKVRSQQVRLAVLRKIEGTDAKWEVADEESVWRQWSVLLRTLEFWVPVSWTTLPGCGPQKYPTEWIAN